MNNQATLDQLTSMRLWGMKNAFSNYLETSAQLTNDELMAHLVEAEWTDRLNRRIERLLRNARFRYSAQIADLNFESPRGLDKNLMLRLGEGNFIRAHENLLITGPTGCGNVNYIIM
jgi:DNA replication protein DnaC